MPSFDTPRTAGVALGGAVFGLGAVSSFVGERLFELTSPRVVSVFIGRMAADAVETLVLALGPIVAASLLFRRTPLGSLSRSTLGAIALLAGLIGEYFGLIVSSTLDGSGVPSPIGLVTPSDVAVGLDAPGIAAVSLVAVVVSGVWWAVGVFAGIGVANLDAVDGGSAAR